MNKPNPVIVQQLKIFVLLSLIVSNHAATIIHNPKLTNMDDGFLELQPNGSLILRSTLNSSSNIWQEALIFKTILNAIRLMPLKTKNTLNDLNEKIYGEGVEHKFPPFMERVIQRIQTYFSIYRYTDTSQPVREDTKLTSTTTAKTTTKTTSSSSPSTTSQTTSRTTSETSAFGQNEIDVTLNSASYYDFIRNNETTANVDTYKRPLETSTGAAVVQPTLAYDAEEDEENEFVEIKDRKSFRNKKS